MQHKVHAHAEWLLAQHNNVEFYSVMRSQIHNQPHSVATVCSDCKLLTTTGCLQLQTDCNRMFVHLLSIFLAHAYVWKLHSGQTQGVASLSYLSVLVSRVGFCETSSRRKLVSQATPFAWLNDFELVGNSLAAAGECEGWLQVAVHAWKQCCNEMEYLGRVAIVHQPNPA